MKTILVTLSILMLAVACDKRAPETKLQQEAQEARHDYNKEMNDAAQEREEEMNEAREDFRKESNDRREEQQEKMIDQQRERVDRDGNDVK